MGRLEEQLDRLKEKLLDHKGNAYWLVVRSRVVGAFEQMTCTLTEQLSQLQRIVGETIEQCRSLHVLDGRLVVERHLQQDGAMRHPLELDRQLSQCYRIAVLEDLSVSSTGVLSVTLRFCRRSSSLAKSVE